MMKHYTNKNTFAVFGYESIDDAKKFNNDFDNLIEMSDDLIKSYKNRPIGAKWTTNGWIVDDNLFMQEQKDAQQKKMNQNQLMKNSLINEANEKIAILQDAIDLKMQKEGEDEQLKAWKKYRILLTHVDLNLVDVEWPKMPD